jgi:hypothetical protein
MDRPLFLLNIASWTMAYPCDPSSAEHTDDGFAARWHARPSIYPNLTAAMLTFRQNGSAIGVRQNAGVSDSDICSSLGRQRDQVQIYECLALPPAGESAE